MHRIRILAYHSPEAARLTLLLLFLVVLLFALRVPANESPAPPGVFFEMAGPV
jgi:hypothetical protein